MENANFEDPIERIPEEEYRRITAHWWQTVSCKDCIYAKEKNGFIFCEKTKMLSPRTIGCSNGVPTTISEEEGKT